MITLLKRLFLDNWLRKLVAFVLAIVIWFVVNRSMTETKVVPDVPVRVINLSTGRTIEGMQANGTLNEPVSLTLNGNKTILDEIGPGDLEVILDATGKPNEWIATIGKKDLVCLNPEINFSKGLVKVLPVDRMIRQSKLVQEKIPITVTQPIGEAPKGYQYLDVFPYHLSLTVVGPEETIKKLKNRGGLQLTFNLADITESELDILQKNEKKGSDDISFFVPNSWKKIAIPGLSENEVEIDDPGAKGLRIDFARQDLLPIGCPIPVTVFFPPKYTKNINPENYALECNDFIVKKNGLKMINASLYAQGISRRFLDLVKDRIQVAIIASPDGELEHLLWNVQFVCPHELEDRFVAKLMAESTQELRDLQPHLREDYLRNRFRTYMNKFRLYTPNHKKLRLDIKMEGGSIVAMPENYP